MDVYIKREFILGGSHFICETKTCVMELVQTLDFPIKPIIFGFSKFLWACLLFFLKGI